MLADPTYIKELGGRIQGTGIAHFCHLNGTFLYANQAFLSIVELSASQLAQEPSALLGFVPPEDFAYLSHEYQLLMQNGSFSNIEVRLKFPAGNEKMLLCDASLEKDNTILLLVKDVSSRKNREDYVIKVSAQKDTLLDMLTHNLSGPLFLTMDMLKVLGRNMEDKLENGLPRMVELLQHNTEHCIDIINDFLKKEHFESMQVSVSRSRFDVIEMINITLEKLRELNKDKSFVFTSSTASFYVQSDAVKFFQVLHNILSNSIKYTHEHGVINVGLKSNLKFFTVCVQDNGIGILPEIKGQIFTKRVEGTPGVKGEKSSGLGLAIARQLVDLMGGRIWCESEPGRGTALYIELPAE
jgi:two-component system sensor histidine kinase VicK